MNLVVILPCNHQASLSPIMPTLVHPSNEPARSDHRFVVDHKSLPVRTGQSQHDKRTRRESRNADT